MSFRNPLNDDSDLEAVISDPNTKPYPHTEPSTHIPLNSESESDSPYTNTPPPRQEQQQETRGRALPPHVRLEGQESDADEDQAGAGAGQRKPYVRSRSRTPRGATSRSRSRGPGSALGGSEQQTKRPITAIPLNDESEDFSASSSGEGAELAPVAERVALNSGSDTDGGPEPPQQSRSGGRAEGRSEGLRAGGAGNSRSRSRGRVAKYAVELNSQSESELEEQVGGGGEQGALPKGRPIDPAVMDSQDERE